MSSGAPGSIRAHFNGIQFICVTTLYLQLLSKNVYLEFHKTSGSYE